MIGDSKHIVIITSIVMPCLILRIKINQVRVEALSTRKQLMWGVYVVLHPLACSPAPALPIEFPSAVTCSRASTRCPACEQEDLRSSQGSAGVCKLALGVILGGGPGMKRRQEYLCPKSAFDSKFLSQESQQDVKVRAVRRGCAHMRRLLLRKPT